MVNNSLFWSSPPYRESGLNGPTAEQGGGFAWPPLSLCRKSAKSKKTKMDLVDQMDKTPTGTRRIVALDACVCARA